MQEVADVAFAYVKSARLEEGAPDERTLVLDATLCDALFKGVRAACLPFAFVPVLLFCLVFLAFLVLVIGCALASRGPPVVLVSANCWLCLRLGTEN